MKKPSVFGYAIFVALLVECTVLAVATDAFLTPANLGNVLRQNAFTAILASSIVLGLAVMLAVKAPVWAGALIVGGFAFFHGHAHGNEAGGASLIPYAAGFAIATAALHGAGIGLGLIPFLLLILVGSFMLGVREQVEAVEESMAAESGGSRA